MFTNPIQALLARLDRVRLLRKEARLIAAGATMPALAVVREGAGREALRAIFLDAGGTLSFADDVSSAIAQLKREPFSIVLYERELGGNDWRDELSRLSGLSPHPCVVLLSRTTDQNLWDEVVRLGGFELLRMPPDRDATLRTLRAASSIWRNRQSAAHSPRAI